MLKQLCLTSLLSPLLLILPGCNKPEAPESEKTAAPPAVVNSGNSIVIDVGEKLSVAHEAQPGQTLEWRSNSPQTPNFWVQFITPSPCKNGALVLSGGTTKAASCVAGNPGGREGTITYSYYIYSTPPPALPSPGVTTDQIVRCLGCNN